MAKHRSFSSLINLQSHSINFKFGHFMAKYQGYSLTFWPKIAHFHHFSICNQSQSISILVICRQTTKPIALLFGQQSLSFITFGSAIKINHCHFWSFVGKYQGYSLTFWPKVPHFHHFSICNQNQSMSILIICRQNYQGYSLTLWPNIAHFHHLSICSHTQSISNFFILWQNTEVIALLFGQKSLIFITFQSAIKIN